MARYQSHLTPKKLKVWGVGFRVPFRACSAWGLGFRAWGLGFRCSLRAAEGLRLGVRAPSI